MTSQKESSQKKKIPVWGLITIIVIGIIGLFVILPVVLLVFISSFSASAESSFSSSQLNVAFIKIDGTILTQSQSSLFGGTQSTSSEQIVSILERIGDDKKIKGIIFEINSPGGSGVAADEISRAIAQLDKPTVSYIREMGTSASYWIASSTDYIYANRLSAVGSIGVLSGFLDFSEFIDQYNISYQRFVAGENKDFGSPFVSPTDEQRQHFQSVLDSLYDVFVMEVSQNRNMSQQEVLDLADGMFYSGVQALEIGLIDEIGSKNDAITHLEKQLNATVNLVSYTRQPTFFEAVFSMISQSFYEMGKGIGSSISLIPEQKTQITI